MRRIALCIAEVDRKGQPYYIRSPPSPACSMRSIAACIVGLTLAVNLGVGPRLVWVAAVAPSYPVHPCGQPWGHAWCGSQPWRHHTLFTLAVNLGATLPPMRTNFRVEWRVARTAPELSTGLAGGPFVHGRGEPLWSPLPWHESASPARSSMVGANPCGRPARATAAALHSCSHSPTKS